MRCIAAVDYAACSSKAPSPPDASASLTIDDIVAACEIDAACNVGRGGAGVQDCLTYFAEGRGLLSPAQVHCIAGVDGSCEQARACIGETFTTTSSCAGDMCAGSVASQCVFGGQIADDCAQYWGAAPGMTCLASGGMAKCSLGSCAAGDADTCDGAVAKRCNAPYVDAGDCASLGLTCQVINSVAECTGEGAACTNDRLDSSAVYDCRIGFEHRIECGAAISGTSPQTDPTSSRAFCGLATDCLPWMTTPQCSSATTLSVCRFGAMHDIDCTALGFAGCHLDSCQ
jgi:hypothetical protein